MDTEATNELFQYHVLTLSNLISLKIVVELTT